MSDPITVKPSPKAIKESEAMWVNFLVACKICGGLSALTLILMAIFLV